MAEKGNVDEKVAGGNSRPAICSTAGYQRASCSLCGEGLGFTEGDPCDRCDDFISPVKKTIDVATTVIIGGKIEQPPIDE